MDLIYLKTAFVTLFVAVDPIGLAPIFLALTMQMTMSERRQTAWRSVTIAIVVLVAAALGGERLLETLGISIPAFRIAGGLLLFSIAAEMVFERRSERKTQSAETAMAQDHITRVAAFPLAIPLMAGPGAITATILQASAAHGNVVQLSLLVGVLVGVLGSCLIVFLLATPIDRILGVTGRVVLSRLLGILLAAMAVQIVGDGVLSFK